LTPRKKKNPSGGIYYSMDVELVIMFGLTEIQAQLAWMEDVRISIYLEASVSDPLFNLRAPRNGTSTW